MPEGVQAGQSLTPPQTDEERNKFREELQKAVHELTLGKELTEKFDLFFKMHHMEMMTRLSFANSLHNRELVFTAFKKDFPGLKIEDYLKLIPYLTMKEIIERMFKEHQESHQKMCDSMAKATEHFNRSCKVLTEIERIEKKGGPNDKRDELIADLIDLHKGNRGTERRWY